jgi:hypothetical protein
MSLRDGIWEMPPSEIIIVVRCALSQNENFGVRGLSFESLFDQSRQAGNFANDQRPGAAFNRKRAPKTAGVRLNGAAQAASSRTGGALSAQVQGAVLRSGCERPIKMALDLSQRWHEH